MHMFSVLILNGGKVWLNFLCEKNKQKLCETFRNSVVMLFLMHIFVHVSAVPKYRPQSGLMLLNIFERQKKK